MILKTRIFNKRTGEMVYMPELKPENIEAYAIVAKQKDIRAGDPIMLETPMLDVNGIRLSEGDICDCGVIASYGAVRERGVVVWRADLNQFTLNILHNYEDKGQFEVVEGKRIGNIYQNPELMKMEVIAKKENA